MRSFGVKAKFKKAPVDSKPAALSEAKVTEQLKDFLESMGWDAIRMHRGMFRDNYGNVVTVGRKGTADWLFLKYIPNSGLLGTCVHLWVEAKATGKKAKCICATKKPRQACTRCDQAKFRMEIRAKGGVVWQVDSIDWFKQAYATEFRYLHEGEFATGQTMLAGIL